MGSQCLHKVHDFLETKEQSQLAFDFRLDVVNGDRQ